MANGNFAGGSGSVSSPYLIEDALDLNAVRNNLTANYKLIKNIDLNISPYNTGEGWESISNFSSENGFNGIFDGNGYIIKNIYINRPSSDYQGIFGCINKAYLKNLKVENVNITGNTYVGGITGRCISSNILNCCCVKGSITSSDFGGGISGDTTCSDLSIQSIISNCYSNVVSQNGITSRITTENKIINCYVIGHCTISGIVSSINDTSTVVNSYWDTETSGQSHSVGGIGKTTLEMKTPSIFIDWDKEKLDDGRNVWILQNGQYPELWFEKSPIKFLIKQNNQYYSIKPEFYSNGNYSPLTLTGSNSMPNTDDYNNNGFDDIGTLCTSTTVGSDTFRPIDKFGENKVTGATFTTTDNLTYTVNPTTNIPFKKDSVIAYENGTVVTPSSIDLINGKVVFSTARTGTMTFDYTWINKFNIMMYKPS